MQKRVFGRVFCAVFASANALLTGKKVVSGGGGAQFHAAIDLLKKEIKDDPRSVPQHPAYPDKSFKYAVVGERNALG